MRRNALPNRCALRQQGARRTMRARRYAGDACYGGSYPMRSTRLICAKRKLFRASTRVVRMAAPKRQPRKEAAHCTNGDCLQYSAIRVGQGRPTSHANRASTVESSVASKLQSSLQGLIWSLATNPRHRRPTQLSPGLFCSQRRAHCFKTAC